MTLSVKKYTEWQNRSEDEFVSSSQLICSPKKGSFNGNSDKKVKERKQAHKSKRHRHHRRKSDAPTIIIERNLDKFIPKRSRSLFLTPDEVDQINGPEWSGKSVNSGTNKITSRMTNILANGPDFIALSNGKIVSADQAESRDMVDLVVNVGNASEEMEHVTAKEGEPVKLIAKPIFLNASSSTDPSVSLLLDGGSASRILTSENEDYYPEPGLRRTILRTTFHPQCPTIPACSRHRADGFHCERMATNFPRSTISTLPFTNRQPIELPPVYLMEGKNAYGQTVHFAQPTSTLANPPIAGYNPNSMCCSRIAPSASLLINPYQPATVQQLAPQKYTPLQTTRNPGAQPAEFRHALMGRLAEMAGIGTKINEQLLIPSSQPFLAPSSFSGTNKSPFNAGLQQTYTPSLNQQLAGTTITQEPFNSMLRRQYESMPVQGINAK